MRPAFASVIARIAQIDRRLDELDAPELDPTISGAQALGFEQIDLAGSALAMPPTTAAEALAVATLLATEVDAADSDPRSRARIERGFENLCGYLEAVAGVTSIDMGLASYRRACGDSGIAERTLGKRETT